MEISSGTTETSSADHSYDNNVAEKSAFDADKMGGGENILGTTET